MGAPNYYLVLGVAEDADAVTIRRAFRNLARRYHPDAGTGSSSAGFRRVVEAYETLNDPGRRRQYDDRLRAARAWAGPRTVADERRAATPEPLFAPRSTAVLRPGARSKDSGAWSADLRGWPVRVEPLAAPRRQGRDPRAAHPTDVFTDDLLTLLEAHLRWTLGLSPINMS